MKYLFSVILLLVLISCGNQVKKTEPKETRLTGEESLKYIAKGEFIVKGATRVLGRHIKEKMSSGGILAAVQYCNLVAHPLVDSLSKKFDVSIQRITHKARNPKNKANLSQMKILEEFEEISGGGMTSPPVVTKSGDKTKFYSPINIKPFCLNCHGGAKTNIGEEKYKFIKKLYPKDEAVDFSDGDLRGMWVIEFDD
jgi:Protein of unknown function (DUF3365)